MRLTQLARRLLVALAGDDFRPFVDVKPAWTRAPRWLVRDPGCPNADGHPSLTIWIVEGPRGYPPDTSLVRPLTAAGELLSWWEVRP